MIGNSHLDFTSKQQFTNNQHNSLDGGNYNYPIVSMTQQNAENRIVNSGKKATKRSVSETKKKWVASNQNWKCGNCNKQLNAWFEVDHKISLEHQGTNHVNNLVALCRECHGEKTARERIDL